MPRKEDDGSPDALIPVQILMPRWLKERMVARAKSKATDSSNYVRGLIVADLPPEPKTTKK